ncbi:MAG TPA: epoxide hydrolase N-terminal domain-containing protein [Terracidiphilus sp.]|jgi:hypothetical protein
MVIQEIDGAKEQRLHPSGARKAALLAILIFAFTSNCAALNPDICNGLVEPNPPSLRAVNSMFEDDASNQAAQQERDDSAIRPFRIDIPDAELTDMRRRINDTRWPERETVSDDSQGVQLETMRELASYWGTEYNWRRCEASLNALPQFITRIDGLDIHFIHVRSKHENALPLIVSHGWALRGLGTATALFTRASRGVQVLTIGCTQTSQLVSLRNEAATAPNPHQEK